MQVLTGRLDPCFIGFYINQSIGKRREDFLYVTRRFHVEAVAGKFKPNY
jgi:hypothetical protein